MLQLKRTKQEQQVLYRFIVAEWVAIGPESDMIESMVDATEYLSRKKVALSDKLAVAISELDDLKKEIRRVDAAIVAIEGVDKKISIQESNQKQGRRVVKKHHQYSYKELILRVLRDVHAGLTANEILDAIKSYYGIEIMRTSISPQLSRLKRDGKLKLKGKHWQLVDWNTPQQAELDIKEQSPDREGQD